ncbi:non-homologous end-joining DNA ligase [Pseudonocardia nantongensis]|uniref:non-homologous end-joining DNA ligase n=1 Tax=Pseudonocardia nantongensis TaxID=1181885 RepID=UPI00397B601D
MTTDRQQITHPDKVLYPGPGVTKERFAAYLEQVAEVMLPHLAGRPLVQHRFPDGVEQPGFYQKQVSAQAPDVVDTIDVHADTRRGHVEHVVADDVETLRYLANQACLELHRWLSRSDDLDVPDLLVVDLDPPERGDLGDLRHAVRAARDLLDEIGLVPHLMATGSSGYHVVAPLERGEGFDEVRALARAVADRLAAADPDRLTVEQRVAARGNRIFLDTNRNAYAQTAIAPYSPRARPEPTVATPIEFPELGKVRPDGYDLAGVLRRLARKDDPWADIHAHTVPAVQARRALETMEPRSEGASWAEGP